MSGQTIKDITDYACYRNRKLDPPFVRRIAILAFDDLWRSRLWKFRLVRGQITAVADYTTGKVSALTQGLKAVTGAATVWTAAFVGRHLRPTNNSGNGDARDYLIDGRSADTAITILDPYEGATIASDTAYTVYQRWYRLPPDFCQLALAQDSSGPTIVRHLPISDFHDDYPSPNSSGDTFWIVDAGTTRDALYSTGTVTMTENSTTVSGSSTVWAAARDEGRRYRIPSMPQYGDFAFKTVASTISATLDRPWRGSTKSGLAYEIDPAGEPLVELYPRPSSNTSIGMWYYRNLPPLAIDTESPVGLPVAYHDAWLYATLVRLDLAKDADLDKRLGPLLRDQNLVAHERKRTLPYGSTVDQRQSLLSNDYPPHFHR